jgi:hypothetical protein
MLAATLANYAHAADATGAIKTIDTKARTVTLTDGKVYVLPDKFDAAQLKVGQTIKVTFSMKAGRNLAASIAPIGDGGIVAPCD